MNDNVKLAERLIYGRLYDFEVVASPDSLETDRRKQARVVKEAIAAGYLEPAPAAGDPVRYQVTSKALDELPAAPAYLVGIWDGLPIRKQETEYEKMTGRYAQPFLRLGRYGYAHLTLGQLKTVLSKPEEYRWYVAETWPLDHCHAWKPEMAFGPMTLAEAQAKYRELTGGKAFEGKTYEICVGNLALSVHLDQIQWDATVDYHYRRCLPWALVKLGVLAKDEAGKVLSEDGDMLGGLFAAGGHVNPGADPAKWELTLDGNIDACLKQLDRIAERLRIARKIQKGVLGRGGWDQFRADARAALIKALEKRGDLKSPDEPRPVRDTDGHTKGDDVDPDYYCACGLPWDEHRDPEEAAEPAQTEEL